MEVISIVVLVSYNISLSCLTDDVHIIPHAPTHLCTVAEYMVQAIDTTSMHAVQFSDNSHQVHLVIMSKASLFKLLMCMAYC